MYIDFLNESPLWYWYHSGGVIAGLVVTVVLGAIIFGTVSMGIYYTGVDSDLYKTFLGAMVLIAVIFNNFIRKRVTAAK